MTISCVIPTHDRNDFLRESLESIGAQTLPPLEVIVASDIPNPEAERITHEFSQRSGIEARFVDNSAGAGASSSRNAGAAVARGDLLAFLDDDDLWRPGYLEQASAAMTRDDVDLVVTWISKFSGDVVQDGANMPPGLSHTRVAAVNPGATGSNVLLRRSAFDDVGGYDIGLPVRNDTDFLYRFLAAGKTYAVVSARNVLQRKHDRGQLMSLTEARARGTELYLAKHGASLRLRDRNRIRGSIHRIRFHSSRTLPAKLKHAFLIVVLSPVDIMTLLRDIKHRRMVLVRPLEERTS
ncbi:glycosyltransferase family 2 protein [Microbacterium sp. No. 7]|uniref:glycosyltransferase family 2 protein n=1 Tax=Microbacterium sp. No. 7 TaxID=1714373 RepID=UPI0006D05671|nr:glycosyltransferase [Microbacterium sp. No. 7]